MRVMRRVSRSTSSVTLTVKGKSFAFSSALRACTVTAGRVVARPWAWLLWASSRGVPTGACREDVLLPETAGLPAVAAAAGT